MCGLRVCDTHRAVVRYMYMCTCTCSFARQADQSLKMSPFDSTMNRKYESPQAGEPGLLHIVLACNYSHHLKAGIGNHTAHAAHGNGVQSVVCGHSVLSAVHALTNTFNDFGQYDVNA